MRVLALDGSDHFAGSCPSVGAVDASGVAS